jgi:FkbM family methyltransferase
MIRITNIHGIAKPALVKTKKYARNMEIDYIINQGIEIKGIIQVGANTGQEISEYKNYTKNIMCFEPINEVIETLKKNHPDVLSYNIALGELNSLQTMYLASNNFESSSFLKPNNHVIYYPHITFENTRDIRIFRFDCLGVETENKYNVLKSDTQGFELQVLRGFGKELSNFDAICVEFIDSNQYENDSSLSKIQEYLELFGFKLGKILGEFNGSGDAIFIKNIFTEKKEFRIICDGGLGNRMNSLLSGLIISDMLGYTPYAHWPANNWCGCKLDDLFIPNFKYDDKSITEIYNEFPDYLYLIHVNQLDRKVDMIQIGDEISAVHQARANGKNVIYYNCLFPQFLKEEDILNKLKSLEIREDILSEIINFYNNNIGEGEIADGVHVRLTDFPENINIDGLFEYVKSSGNKTFVCSDDKEGELKFSNLPNVVTFTKSDYAAKMNLDSGWRDLTEDTEGRYFYFNVKRSAQSVIEAFKDLLILSRTNIIKTSNTSTFLNLAMLYSKLNRK